MIPPPSSFVVSFDSSELTTFRHPSYVSFQITLQAYNMVVHVTLLDEGVSVSIMSSITWKALGSHRLCLSLRICWLSTEEPIHP